MPRSTCPACGATVDIARVKPGSGALPVTVPLETNGDASRDAPRYRIVRQRPLLVERVAEHAVGDYLADHRFDCPGANAGRR